MSFSKSLLAAAGLAVVWASLSPAAIITDVTFVGDATNPTVNVYGFGFNPAVDPTSLATLGFSGQDYGVNLHLVDYADNPNAFDAGYDDPSTGLHDDVGLDNVSFSDTLVSFQFGSEYAFYGPTSYQLQAGDSYTVFINDASYFGAVSYPADASTIPEPATTALIGAGLVGFGIVYKRRVRSF